MNPVNIITNLNSNIIPDSSSGKLLLNGGLSVKVGDELKEVIDDNGNINLGIIDNLDNYINNSLLSFGQNSWLVNAIKSALDDPNHIFNNLPESDTTGDNLVLGTKELIRLIIAAGSNDHGFLMDLLLSYFDAYNPDTITTFLQAKDNFINIINIFKYSTDCSYITILIKASSDLLDLDRSMGVELFLDALLFVISRFVDKDLLIDTYNVLEINGNT